MKFIEGKCYGVFLWFVVSSESAASDIMGHDPAR